jgi:hypothetical protein
VQLTLLGACDPSPLPVYPNVVEAPAPIVPLYEAFFTVTAPLVPLFTPFHSWLMLCPLGRVMCTVQPLSVDDPALATVTVAWKPPGQLLTGV